MIKNRHQTRQIRVGRVPIGGGAPVAVQSMTNTLTTDRAATVAQIEELTEAGCEIVRVAFPDEPALKQLEKIKAAIQIPLIADIHFKAELAVRAIEAGADAVRVNPGNLGGLEKFALVIAAAQRRSVPIRIGVNAGSLPAKVAEKFGGSSAAALLESAREYVAFCREHDFADYKLSLKSAAVLTTIEAYRMAAEAFDCPLHLGVTEAGTLVTGAVKSAIGIGLLLASGIGDTLRVSLSTDPVEEVRVAWEILKALGLRQRGVSVVACPTCSRTELDVSGIAERVEKIFRAERRPLRIAVMGCPVNGPGEAKEADIGLAGSPAGGMIFRAGQVVERVDAAQAEAVFIQRIRELLETK
jgi:(E)-4-hydroxy-3-methylbut-2-enyl-diphosphate synthase